MDKDMSELLQKLKDFRDALPAVLPDVAVSVSMAGKALAERVIKERGFSETYSTNAVPAYWFKGRELNQRGLDYLYSLKDTQLKKATVRKPRKTMDSVVKTWGIKGVTTWGKFREAQGLQSGHVDLTYSGKMWAGMFPEAVQVNLFDYIAPLGNNTAEGQKKMNYTFEQYGDYIGKVLTGDNMDLLYDVAFDELARMMDDYLGWKKE